MKTGHEAGPRDQGGIMKSKRTAICVAALACVVSMFVGCPKNAGVVDQSITVTFDSRGGGSVPAVKVLPGDTVDEPGNITNAADGNLIFSGWYTETACETRWDFGDPVEESITLYAKWNAADTLAFTAISDGAAWEVAAGTGALDADLYIPAYYKGIPVIRTADRSFYQKSTLQSVILPEEMTSISDWSFYNCASLTRVLLPSGLLSIGYCAFTSSPIASIELPSVLESIGGSAFSSTKIDSIHIPASVTTIATWALSGCTNMTEITVDAGNSGFAAVNGVLFNKALTYLHTYPAGRSGTEYAIPSGVTEIGYGAFSNASLTGVTLPTGVTVLRSNAFSVCSALNTINIPTSVTSIETRAFAYSFRSTPSTIFIPDSVGYLGLQEFWGCSNLSIRCQAASQPAGWADSWNQDGRPVTWGCSE